ncbi:hypothetical protein VF21_07761 [Pseudogymnoascus sp. 05NY08]|nr:hypothetical protein VF21_07761 [Pseudogymnoascus sp. 05NY08]
MMNPLSTPLLKIPRAPRLIDRDWLSLRSHRRSSLRVDCADLNPPNSLNGARTFCARSGRARGVRNDNCCLQPLGPPDTNPTILSLPRRTPAVKESPKSPEMTDFQAQAWQLVRNANAGTDRPNTAALADLHRLPEHAIWISAASTWRALPESREAGEYGGRYGWGSCGAALRTLRC